MTKMVSDEESASEALNVALMRHAEARSVNEVWAGKTDIKERRRLQNRLNRRAYSAGPSNFGRIIN